VYRPDFITDSEEREVVATLEGLDFAEVRMHGQAARRTVRHFGYRYGYESWTLTPTDPLPPSLFWLRDRAGHFVGVAGELFIEVLATRYPPGAGIGWHRDAPLFGPKVVGVSLGSSCAMRFQRRTATQRHTYALELAPRSAYVLSGSARSTWQHSIPPTKSLRYSLTFRTLTAPVPVGRRRPRRPAQDGDAPGAGRAEPAAPEEA
jgi:alkylated DNA repair dioxygenase AlkB